MWLERAWDELWARNRFYGQSVTIYTGKSNKTMQNWTKSEKNDICFCKSFDHNRKQLIFREETEHLPVSPPNLDSFFFFPNLWSNSYMKFILLDVRFLLFLLPIKRARKQSKLQKYYATDCLQNFSFPFYVVNNDTNFWKKPYFD